MGKFQNLVLKERAIVRATQSVIVHLNVDNTPNEIKTPIRISEESEILILMDFQDGYKTNTFKQKQDGYVSVFITLEAGDITANQLRVLALYVREFSGESMARNGFSQDVIINM